MGRSCLQARLQDLAKQRCLQKGYIPTLPQSLTVNFGDKMQVGFQKVFQRAGITMSAHALNVLEPFYYRVLVDNPKFTQSQIRDMRVRAESIPSRWKPENAARAGSAVKRVFALRVGQLKTVYTSISKNGLDDGARSFLLRLYLRAALVAKLRDAKEEWAQKGAELSHSKQLQSLAEECASNLCALRQCAPAGVTVGQLFLTLLPPNIGIRRRIEDGYLGHIMGTHGSELLYALFTEKQMVSAICAPFGCEFRFDTHNSRNSRVTEAQFLSGLAAAVIRDEAPADLVTQLIAVMAGVPPTITYTHLAGSIFTQVANAHSQGRDFDLRGWMEGVIALTQTGVTLEYQNSRVIREHGAALQNLADRFEDPIKALTHLCRTVSDMYRRTGFRAQGYIANLVFAVSGVEPQDGSKIPMDNLLSCTAAANTQYRVDSKSAYLTPFRPWSPTSKHYRGDDDIPSSWDDIVSAIEDSR